MGLGEHLEALLKHLNRSSAFVKNDPRTRGVRKAAIQFRLNPDGTLKPEAELAKVFESAGIDIAKPVVTSCGTGVTAAILSLGLTTLNARDHALYDGSWTDWGSAIDTPVVTGE